MKKNEKLAKKIATRIINSAPVILAEGGFKWGFFFREEPRMHLQTTGEHEGEYHVWLERDGKKVFEPNKWRNKQTLADAS